MAAQGVEGKRKGPKCQQRPKRCSALEPVLEHCELASVDCASSQQCTAQAVAQKGIPLRILAKLRDGYVKLMNEVATGTDLSGASSFYGATAGPGDFPPCTMLPTSRTRPTVA